MTTRRMKEKRKGKKLICSKSNQIKERKETN